MGNQSSIPPFAVNEESFITVEPTYLRIRIVSHQSIQRGCLHSCRNSLDAYLIATGDILVPDGHIHVVADVFYVNIEDLVPFWGLTGALQCASSHFLLSRDDFRPRVHLTEPFRVACQLCLDHMKAQIA